MPYDHFHYCFTTIAKIGLMDLCAHSKYESMHEANPGSTVMLYTRVPRGEVGQLLLLLTFKFCHSTTKTSQRTKQGLKATVLWFSHADTHFFASIYSLFCSWLLKFWFLELQNHLTSHVLGGNLPWHFIVSSPLASVTFMWLLPSWKVTLFRIFVGMHASTPELTLRWKPWATLGFSVSPAPNP